MKKELMQYVPVLRFLRDALGESFRVALVDADNTAFAISPSDEGLKEEELKDETLRQLLEEILAGEVLKNNDYLCSFSGPDAALPEKKYSVLNICSQDRGIAGFLCIEQTRGELFMVEEVFDEILKGEGSGEGGSGRIGREVDSLIKERITSVWQRYSSSGEKLKKSEKVAFISELFEMGIFRIRGGAAQVSEVTGISQASIYRYLGEVLED